VGFEKAELVYPMLTPAQAEELAEKKEAAVERMIAKHVGVDVARAKIEEILAPYLAAEPAGPGAQVTVPSGAGPAAAPPAAAGEPYAPVPATAGPPVQAGPRHRQYGVSAENWAEYQSGVAVVLRAPQEVPYTAASGTERRMDFQLTVGTGVAAGEAKFVEGRWSRSLYNPQLTFPLAGMTQANAYGQALDYSQSFATTLYVSNSPELIEEYSRLFQQQGLRNIRSLLIPTPPPRRGK
jgi:hypothetical protein